MAIVVVGVCILVGCLYVAIGTWLGRHGGAHRGQLWLMDIIVGVAVMGAIFMAIEPFDLRTVGWGAGLGAVAGAIWGLFHKVPPAARSQNQRQDTAQPR
jgi:hypothetical protein